MTPGSCSERCVLEMAEDSSSVDVVVAELRQRCGVQYMAALALILKMTKTHGLVIRGGKVEVE